MIVILTDFKDTHYQGIMKGIIKTINPTVEIIDLCNVNSFSIKEASWILKNSYHFFPKGTIFLCCVEPKKEKPIIVKTNNYFFIASDNNLLNETINEDKIELIVEIKEKESNREQLYAKVSAKLSIEMDVLKLGKAIKLNQLNNHNQKNQKNNYQKNNKKINQEVVMIDNFGNIITNIKSIKDITKNKIVKNNKKDQVNKITKTNNENNKNNKYNKNKNISFKLKNKKLNYYVDFSDAKKNEMFITKGTSNTLEICIKEGNASEKLKLNVGDKIDLKWI